MKSNKTFNTYRLHLLFLSILFLGIFLRFFMLGSIPKSLNWDEVSWGYNAFAIATTGHDEHGVSYPLSFEAFGDFKQPVYIYLDAVPMAIWGLTPFAVRFPSALFGSLTIIFVFLLVFELFYNHKYRNRLALLTMFLFAVSPWSVQFSRVAFEANVGVFFTISGASLFLMGLRQKKPWLLAMSTIIISLSCYTYHSQKIFTPLFFLVLLWFARAYLMKKRFVIALLVGVFILSNIVWVIDMRTTSRGRSVMFTEQWEKIIGDSPKYILEDSEQGNKFGSLVHNRRILLADKYIEQYLKHFDPNFLFLTGDNPRHHPPFMGVLFVLALPFIIIGMIGMIKREKRAASLLFPWLLLAPVASSLAINAPNASRSMVFLPTWDIFAAFGVVLFWVSIRKLKVRKLLVFGLGIVVVLQIGFYIHNYFAHTDTEAAKDWQYGYKEAAEWAGKQSQAQSVVFLSDVEQSYIFYLFYNKISPSEFSNKGLEYVAPNCLRYTTIYFGSCLDIVKSGYLVTGNPPPPTFNTQAAFAVQNPDTTHALTVYRFSEKTTDNAR